MVALPRNKLPHQVLSRPRWRPAGLNLDLDVGDATGAGNAQPTSGNIIHIDAQQNTTRNKLRSPVVPQLLNLQNLDVVRDQARAVNNSCTNAVKAVDRWNLASRGILNSSGVTNGHQSPRNIRILNQ